MTLLAPLFLVGLLAVALPFWLHRLQTESADRKPFSSAMLLETTERRVHVRKKLKYLALLALRVAAVVLIALAFARPLWTNPETLPMPAPDGTHIVLVDTSASMGRSGLFDRALDIARDAIRSAPTGAAIQVVAASSEIRNIGGVSTERSEQLAALDGLAPDAGRLDFGLAMSAASRLAELLPQPVTLHFVSDFQDSGRPARFADLIAANVATLRTHVATAAETRNWSVDALRARPGGADVVVSVSGADIGNATVALTVNGTRFAEQAATGPGTTTLSFDGLTLEPGDNRLRADVAGRDDFALDSTRFQVVRNDPPAPVPLLTADSRGLPVTYLSAALLADPRRAWEIEVAATDSFDPRTLARYRWLIVDDIGSIGGDLETDLRAFVAGGGSLLAFAGKRTAAAARVPLLGNTIGGASMTGPRDGFLSVGQVDRDHPLLAGTEGWYAVNLSAALPIAATADDRVLIRLENGEPFLIERRLGAGRVLLVTGGLENRLNDLPIRPVFVSFMVEAARYLSGSEQLASSLVVGDTLSLAQSGSSSGQVVDPDGQSVLSLADTARAQRISLRKTGFYEVYTPQGEHLVAVNPDARESEFAPMDAATLGRWEDSMGGSVGAETPVEMERQAQPVELWHALLLILVLVLIAESMVANGYLAPRTRGDSKA